MIELDSTLIGNFGFSVIRLTTPIIFATMSAVIASRAGVANIGIEGMMLVSALAGVIVSSATQSLWATLLIVPVLGALLGLLFIVIVEKLKSNAVLTGLAFNIMASGGTVFVLWLLTGDKGASTSLKSLVVPFLEIPGLQNVPILGTILSHHSALTYFAFVCVWGSPCPSLQNRVRASNSSRWRKRRRGKVGWYQRVPRSCGSPDAQRPSGEFWRHVYVNGLPFLVFDKYGRRQGVYRPGYRGHGKGNPHRRHACFVRIWPR